MHSNVFQCYKCVLVAAKKIELTPIIINKPSVAVLVTMLSQAHMENNKTMNCYFKKREKESGISTYGLFLTTCLQNVFSL